MYRWNKYIQNNKYSECVLCDDDKLIKNDEVNSKIISLPLNYLLYSLKVFNNEAFNIKQLKKLIMRQCLKIISTTCILIMDWLNTFFCQIMIIHLSLNDLCWFQKSIAKYSVWFPTIDKWKKWIRHKEYSERFLSDDDKLKNMMKWIPKYFPYRSVF